MTKVIDESGRLIPRKKYLRRHLISMKRRTSIIDTTVKYNLAFYTYLLALILILPL